MKIKTKKFVELDISDNELGKCLFNILYNDDLRIAHKLKEWFYEIHLKSKYLYETYILARFI